MLGGPLVDRLGGECVAGQVVLPFVHWPFAGEVLLAGPRADAADQLTGRQIDARAHWHHVERRVVETHSFQPQGHLPEDEAAFFMRTPARICQAELAGAGVRRSPPASRDWDLRRRYNEGIAARPLPSTPTASTSAPGMSEAATPTTGGPTPTS